MAVVGLLATVVGLIDLADKDPDTDAALAQLADVNPSVGLWLVILAGLVVAVAGVLVVVWGRSRRTAA
jgi:MFS superfamily sulfate permease-like transporter